MRHHIAIRLMWVLGLAVTAAAQGALAQSWPMFGGNVQSTSANDRPTGITAANVRELTRHRVELDGLVDASAIYLHAAAIRGAPHDAIFVTTSYGRTLALDADSGDLLWEYT
ncbi:MAG: hypothetical protein ACRD1F_10185, partial [Terriglobales bacterium]